MSRETGFKIVIDSPKAFFDFDKKKLRAVMRQAGAEVSNVTKQLMRAGGGGRTYYGTGGGKAYKGYKKGRRTASAPGSAPAQGTKTLIRSLKVYPFKSGEGVAVRMKMFYGLMLENGAQGGIPGKAGRGSGKRNTYHRQKLNQLKNLYVRTSLVGRRVVLPRPSLSVALDQKKASLQSRIVAAVKDGIRFKKQK